MKPTLSQPVDPRRAAELRAELLARREAFLAGWHPADEGPDAALTWIAGRYVEAILARLNQAPDKNRTAFLSLMGIERIAAQAARVPVVFELSGQAADLTLPAGSRLSAPPPPESSDEIVFETERAAGLAAAKLTQVVSLWPGRDQWLDHSADRAAGRPFKLFDKQLLADTPHALYLAHDRLLALKGKVRVEVRIELAEPSSVPLTLLWEYWDGAVWRGFAGMRPECGESGPKADSTRGLTRSGRILLSADCAETAKRDVGGIEAFWIRGRLTGPLPPDPARTLPVIDQVRLGVEVESPLADNPPAHDDGVALEKALAGTQPLDTSKAFYPLGQAPKPGDAFYLKSDEVLGKTGAHVTLRVVIAATAAAKVTPAPTAPPPPPDLRWEYWDGTVWRALALTAEPVVKDKPVETLRGPGILRFLVPEDLQPNQVNGEDGRFLRARLANGGYFTSAEVKVDSTTFTVVLPDPPAVAEMRLGYHWLDGPHPAEHVLAENDFRFTDRTEDATWPGRVFPPFELVGGGSPALYLGFDRKLPVDRLSLFFDVVEERETRGPALVWSFWDGIAWQRLPAEDETASLRVPGMVSVIGPQEGAPLARFGTPLHWLRAELAEDGPPGAPTLQGLHPNAVWAWQWQTLTNERIGRASGAPHQVLTLARIPVLGEVGEERIEVRELAGPRAEVEWRLVAREVLGGGERTLRDLEDLLGSEGPANDVALGDVRLRRDRNKKVTEVWVRWQGRRDLLRSGPADRHYALDRTRGRLLFGDGRQGRVPPEGAEVLAVRYRTGGGAQGNVATGAVSRLLAGVPGVQKVFNPHPAEGGADAEGPADLSTRGPRTLAHRGRALSPADYETMAREASAAVALAQALPARDPAGRPRPGWVTLLLLPRGADPRPWPSFGLRERVRRYVEERCPADLAAPHHLYVTGPLYLPVDVTATVAPVDPARAGEVEQQARTALATFLHPLAGGPEGRGWTPGREVCLSDVAALLERVSGVDSVRELALLLDGQLQGEHVPVPVDHLPVAGTLRIQVI